jgi:hypothetical protein
VRVATEIVVMIAVVVMVAVVVASEMIEGESVGIVVRVRKETDREEGTVVRVHKVIVRKVIVHRATGHHVHREIVRRVHREIVHKVIVHRATVVRVRKETDHKESVDHVHREHRATGQRVHRESAQSVRHVQNRRPRRKLRWILPLQPRRHHQQHQPMILVLPRASRGRKPCYWHRHVQNIAASIAVA